ncbi:MAG: sulfurtransferase [Anaerolineae bacterium]|nr:sulfurtransferase [Anaerolineae bacterium]
MTYRTLIAPADLAVHLHSPGWVVVDCRFSLADPKAGEAAYETSHIPGARYANLDEVLSNPPYRDHGRHPLPEPSVMAQRFGALGISNTSQVVVYDDAGGMVAARLWWMLHYLGHEAAAVLDGGWHAWLAAGLLVASEAPRYSEAEFKGEPQAGWLVTASDVPSVSFLVDSRAPERFRGEVEDYDPVRGHIPGAVNYHYARNLDDDGFFLSPPRLRAQLAALHGDTPAAEVTYYCGSGVSACVNLLAQAHAGLPPGRLYAGSWSDWISEPDRPVARDP